MLLAFPKPAPGVKNTAKLVSQPTNIGDFLSDTMLLQTYM